MTLESPYKGLDPFDDSDVDALLFFGREREREIVVANLIAARLTILYGPTGVGKSSLLRAGVARALRELPERPVVVVFDHWGDDPSRDLAAAVAVASGEEADGGLLDVVGSAQRQRDVYLVLDQAEEYFVYHESAASFDADFARLVSDPLRVNVLLSLREDSLAKLDRFKPLIPAVYANSLRLDRLDREAGRIAIVRPVERWNDLTDEDIGAEPALVDAVLDGVRVGGIERGGGLGGIEGNGRPTSVEAPYLQLVMQRVWDVERAADSAVLRASTLTELGGARQVVADHLERAVAELSEPERDVASRLFTYLVTPSGTKIAHDLPDLAEYAHLSAAQAATVVETLSRHRILRTDEAGRIEIFHDVLAAEVLAWRRAHEAVRALERERAESRRRHRRLAWLAGLAFGALLLTTLLAVFAFSQRSDARHQAASAQTAQGQAEEQKKFAERERAEAEAQARKAREAERRAAEQAEAARSAEATAEASQEQEATSAQAAQQSAAEAQQSATEAQTAQKQSEQHAQAESRARESAQKQAAVATSERRRAVRAETRTKQALRDTKARELVQRSLALQTTDPELAVRTALRAARLVPAAMAENALRSSLVALQERHVLRAGGPVRAATYSPDGSLVLVAGGPRGADLFQARSGRRVRTISSSTVLDAAFSPDGRFVATADADNRARLWSVPAGVLLRTLAHEGPVRSVSFSSNGELLVTAGDDWTARVWRADTGARLAVLRHGAPVTSAKLSPDGGLAVTVSGPPPGKLGPIHAQIYDARTGALLHTLQETGITTAQFVADGTLVLTSSTDRTVRFWDARTGRLLSQMNAPDGRVVAAMPSPDGRTIAAATDAGSVYLWDVSNPKNPERLTILSAATLGVTDVAFSPDSRFIVASSLDDTAVVYGVTSGFQPVRLVGHGDGVTSVSFSPNGHFVLTASRDGTARIWRPPALSELRLVGSHKGPVTVVRVSPNGRLAVSASEDGSARIWNLARHTLVHSLQGHHGAVTDAAFSPDGRLVATTGVDRTARLWRVSDGHQLKVFRHKGPVSTVAFSPDGTRLATGSGDGIARIWVIRSGKSLRLRHRGAVNRVAFSPDGSLVVTASADRTATIWRVSDGKRLRVLRGHRGSVGHASFSPDGRLVLTSGADHNARLWRVKDGRLLHSLRGHRGAITDSEFSPNGRLIVTSSVDHDARIWSVSTGKTVHRLRAHFFAVNAASFSPDGRWVVTASRTSAGLWQVSTGLPFSVSLPGFPFLRGHTDRVTGAVFANDARIVTGSKDGTVRTFSCSLCGRLPSLVAIARERLAELEARRRKA